MSKFRSEKRVFRYHFQKFVAFWAFYKIFSGEQRAVDVMVHLYGYPKFQFLADEIQSSTGNDSSILLYAHAAYKQGHDFFNGG